ncbi:hypothetical protein BKA70DRAFT_1316407 [Coprinopsis sp. MPI-PUGE-AT-0042]|nr:hypothetical protein BKA70DRAFT_1316407 [Coprinopsis sp. MPI-PUGE-AT-0042]
MPKVKRLMRMTTALRSFRLSRAVVPQTLAAQNHSLLKLHCRSLNSRPPSHTASLETQSRQRPPSRMWLMVQPC